MSLFDWEQRKFESLIYPEKIKNKNNLQLPAYSISNKNGFIAQTDQFGKDNTYSKTDKKTNYIVNPGAFAYNPARINVGSIGYQNLATPVLVSSLYEVFKTNSQINDLFLIYWFKTDKFFNQIKKYEEGGVRQYYFLDKLLFSEIIIPKDVREQQKISKILKKLDYLISLQQRKLEYFMTIKAELLRSIFPNTVGKRGLHISDQPWKLQTMNDIFKEKNIKNEHGKLLSVSISKGIYPFSENERKNNSSNNKSKYKEVKYNDIAYNSMRMWQGALGVSKYDGIVSPAYTVITAKKQENPLFYYYYFKNKRMLFNFRQHSQGLTSDTWNLKFPLFKKIIIQTPISKKEEQIIANLFKTLDQNIIYTKTKIEKFNYIKQFLLQNMFI